MSEAMSDQETLAATPDAETPATPVNDGIIDLDADNQVQEEAEDEEQPGETEKAEEKPAEEEKPKKLSGAQRAKIRETRLAAENAELQRKLEEFTRKTPAPDASEAEKPPREEDYNGDWFAWQQALTAFNAGKAVKDALRTDRETREASERETKQAAAARERQTAHMERVEAAREVIADFDEAMKGMDGVPVRNEVVEEIMSSDKSAEISYYLAKNPDKLDALNSMSSRELAREMGRLEATVKLPEAKRATSAPAPIRQPKGGAAPHSQEAELAAYLSRTYGDRRR